MRVTTTDIVLASCLVTLNYRLTSIDVNSIGIGTFIIDEVDDRVILAYESGSMRVEPKAYDAAKVRLAQLCRNKSRR